VLHQIGVGALGPVFRTYEPTRDRLVAVKVFRLDITPEQARALADELAKSAEAGLFHPSIVEPIAAGVEGTVAYRADEYVAAESLDVAMRHYAPAPVDKVLPFITQLAGAIDFARAAGVGHGALHPRDIFVTPDEARATGFGVVDALERVGLRAPVRRPYSPPERVAGLGWGTPADVFSLAAIAFELLTARRPAGTGDQIGSLNGSPPTGRADQIRAVLARAMDENPDRRFPSALSFAAALEAAARGEYQAGPDQSVAAAGSPAVDHASVPERQPVQEQDEDVLAAAPIAAAAAHDVDDIEIEREEDEAHWALSREAENDGPSLHAVGGGPEQEEPDTADRLRPEPGSAPDIRSVEGPGRDVIEQGPPRFRLEQDPRSEKEIGQEQEAESEPAAASRPSPVVTPFDARPAPPPRPTLPTRRPPTVFDTQDALIDPDLALHDRAPAEPDRAPVTMLPLAMTLIIGLLLGFAAGYVVGGRSPAPAGGQVASSAAGEAPGPASPDATPAGTTSPPAREFSEGAVAPAPAEGGSPAAGSAAKPANPAPSATADRPAAAPRRGRIVVRSSPAGAAVTVNGDWRGRTPLPLEDLGFGRYTIRVVQPGYEVARREVTISAAQPERTLSLTLSRQRDGAASKRAETPPPKPSAPQTFTGSIFVDSRPRGARVLLDGKEIGTTPLRIPDVPVGSHIVRLELPDHRFWTNSVRVTSGETAQVTGSLEPIR
jgi:hypothetical protein